MFLRKPPENIADGFPPGHPDHASAMHAKKVVEDYYNEYLRLTEQRRDLLRQLKELDRGVPPGILFWIELCNHKDQLRAEEAKGE